MDNLDKHILALILEISQKIQETERTYYNGRQIEWLVNILQGQWITKQEGLKLYFEWLDTSDAVKAREYFQKFNIISKF